MLNENTFKFLNKSRSNGIVLVANTELPMIVQAKSIQLSFLIDIKTCMIARKYICSFLGANSFNFHFLLKKSVGITSAILANNSTCFSCC